MQELAAALDLIVAMSCASSGWVFSSISGTRVKAPLFLR